MKPQWRNSFPILFNLEAETSSDSQGQGDLWRPGLQCCPCSRQLSLCEDLQLLSPVWLARPCRKGVLGGQGALWYKQLMVSTVSGVPGLDIGVGCRQQLFQAGPAQGLAPEENVG